MTLQSHEAEILRLHHAERWPPGTIAAQLGIHHSVVERVLEQDGQPRIRATRPSIVDPYLPFIKETFEKYPKLCASRLHQMVKDRGYPGGPDHLRHLVASLRPRPAPEAYLRRRTLPGEEAQVDWAHFGTLEIGRAVHKLVAFLMVLSYSRMIFLRFYLGAKMENFLRGHVAAFKFFDGVARKTLYDNLKSAVLERLGDAIRFHPTLLALAGHYRFEPRPVAPYRGNEKGRVERAVRFVRNSFFAARTWRDLEDLNAQALEWCQGQAAERRWVQDRSRTVQEAFLEEQALLLPVADDDFPTDERVEVRVGKSPYVRFEKNDYSVPHTQTRRTLVVVGSPKSIRILDGSEVIATHPRSYDRDQEIEDSAHLEALRKYKKKARKASGKHRLLAVAPRVEPLLVELAERGENLGAAVSALLRYLDLYGADWLEEAAVEALKRGTPGARSVRFLLEKRRHHVGQPAPIALELPDDPRVRDLAVRSHDLATYDNTLKKEEADLEDRD